MKSNVTKTVIANYGAGGQGKSTTIKAVYEEIKRRYPHLVKLRPTKGGGDTSALFSINNITIGIESQGDPNSRLFESLDEFIKENCDIIIAACRFKGDTTNAINDLFHHGYRLIWAQNPIHKDSPITQDRLNTHYYVNYILEIFDDILTGTL